ncbi:MAG TPA: DNA-3-methyladenine glycosylase 2 family protein [Thermoanaerobaculia bacterium]|nr:DNA-3-methyladenine glycosylase 2 family protein [Thermoanaerobaculia bacterium]
MTVRFSVTPRRPFSLALTAERYRRFPEVIDRFDGETYRRLLPVGTGGVLLAVRQEGSPDRAVLEVELSGRPARSPRAALAARRIVEVALGAAVPVRPFYRAFAGDGILGAAIRDFRGLRGAGVPSLWEGLVTAILAQQVNLLFAYDIRRELAETFGARARFGGETYFAFPEPAAFAGETPKRMRRFRLSDAKAKAILSLAEAFAAGGLSEAEVALLEDEAAIERLTAFRGVGRWTAEIGLLRGLGRSDIFPAGDLGVVKYLAQGLLGRRQKAREDAMRKYAARWRPWRGLALVYGYAELNRRKAERSAAESSRRSPRAPGTSPSRRG